MPRTSKHHRIWKPTIVQCPACGQSITTGVDVDVEILRWNHDEVVSGGFECPRCRVRLVVRRWYHTVTVTEGSVLSEARRAKLERRA